LSHIAEIQRELRVKHPALLLEAATAEEQAAHAVAVDF